jgi:hemerythrin-like domain-containing protein
MPDATPTPDHDPDAPLHEPVERFRGSHGAITEGLERLRRLPALAQALREARAIAAETLEMFEQHVLPHHADEEKELFVAVSRSAAEGAEKAHVADLVARLVGQHRAVERMWAELRPEVVAVAAGKVHAGPEFEPAVARLVETYLAHTRLEELVFLPLADEILARDPNHLAALGLSLHIRHLPMPRLAYL